MRGQDSEKAGDHRSIRSRSRETRSERPRRPRPASKNTAASDAGGAEDASRCGCSVCVVVREHPHCRGRQPHWLVRCRRPGRVRYQGRDHGRVGLNQRLVKPVGDGITDDTAALRAQNSSDELPLDDGGDRPWPAGRDPDRCAGI